MDRWFHFFNSKIGTLILCNIFFSADLIQEIDSKLPVVQLALELTHKIFGSCPPMQSFDPAKMLTVRFYLTITLMQFSLFPIPKMN